MPGYPCGLCRRQSGPAVIIRIMKILYSPHSASKNTLILFASLGLWIFLAPGFSWADQAGQTSPLASDLKRLYIYSPPDRFSPEIIDKFAKRTGWQIRLESYQTHSELLSRHKSDHFANYDLVLVPASHLARLSATGVFVEIPKDRGQLYHPLRKTDKRFFDFAGYYEGKKYAVPLFWTVLGMLSNTRQERQGRNFSWRQLFMPTSRTHSFVLLDTSRETLGIVLMMLGHSFNSTSLDEITQAGEVVEDLYKTPLFLGFHTEEQSATMCADGLVNMSITTGFEASRRIRKNPGLSFYLAEDGVPVSLEVLAVTSSTKKQEAAFLFMEFITTPEVAAENADFTHQPTANTVAMELVNQNDREDPALYPDIETLPVFEFHLDLGPEADAMYYDAWLAITSKNDSCAAR